MFNFIKKGVSVVERDREKMDRDKERRKKEKKQRKDLNKQNLSGTMSSEELLRLDEVRRSLKIRGRRKEKEKLPSGITADYSANFFAHLDLDRDVERDRGIEETIATIDQLEGNEHVVSINVSHSDSSETSIQSTGVSKDRLLPPIVPPKPPKRGILKGSRQANQQGNHQTTISVNSQNTTVESADLLIKNTLQNELITYENITNQRMIAENSHHSEELNTSTNLVIMTSASPSAESLTDTTNSSFVTPPFSMSPVGESQSFHRWSRVQTFDGVDLPLPPIKLLNLPAPRELVIKRQKPRNDFGFSLRKAICLDRSESLMLPTFKPVIFAEPGTNNNGTTGLLPGDRLIKVNGISVESLPRETIIEMIKNSEEQIVVEVQPVSELVELSRRCMQFNDNSIDQVDKATNCNTLKRSASKRFKNQNNDAGDEIHSQDKFWLIHRGGFAASIKCAKQTSDEHRVRVQLLHNGEQMIVEEDDLEQANPSKLDLVEDICQLKHLNEASVLHCLRQRYANNLIHTRAGSTLIVVNPMAPLSLYSEKVVSMFRGCKQEDMPPHIYSTSQSAYRSMLETRRDQSLIFLGRSGAGKTTSFKHALYYLVLAAGSTNKVLSVEKLNAINTIMEAFGNTKTCMNNNATRFTQLFSLDFDHTGMIASASIQMLLMEKSRAGRRSANDQSFHVLSRLVAGSEGSLEKELGLDRLVFESSNPFVSISQKLEERQKATVEFNRLVQAFDALNIESSAVRGVWMVLASIVHLGAAGVAKVGSGSNTRIQFANASAAQKAADILGISMENLTNTAFSNPTNGNQLSPSTSDAYEAAWDSLEALAVGLYSEAMQATVALINKSICTAVPTIASIILIDTPGFQNPASCGYQNGASISDLRFNYLQERLQLLFHHTALVTPQNRYSQELVEIDMEGISDSDPNQLVSLIDKAPQSHVVRGSQRDLREQDRRGLLWLLDEESMYPGSNDDSFIERLFSHYGDREHQYLLRRSPVGRQFVLQHFQGTNPVLYSVDGWLKLSREHAATKLASTMLQDSSKNDISRLFNGTLTRGSGFIICSTDNIADGHSLRRISSIKRSFATAGVKRNSVMLQLKFTVDGIIDTLRRTEKHFVHCFLLQHNAGSTTIASPNGNMSLISSYDDLVNVPLLRSQLRGSHILEAARLHRLGFPESVPLTEFVRRFGLLGDVSSKTVTVEDILSSNEIDHSTYRIGMSLVLFRCGVLNQLEAKRDELLSDRITQFQAFCRGYLVRRKLAQRRVQELAVRCIQRNVRAFMSVRDWPWWRLLVRVTPLLNVHRTEEQLKMASDELQSLRSKLEKYENERNALKTENSRLELKLSEMTADLTEERSTSNITTERLEAETAERLKLEKELQQQQEKVRNLQDMSEKLEMELICAKSDLNGISEDEDAENDDGHNSSIYKMKYERAAKELEFTKRRLQTQHEHDLDQLIGLKKQLEKKLADAYEEVEEQRQVVGQWKRKSQKLSSEMNDLRMLLDEQNGRNNLLEKKQRKFDSESQSLQDAVRLERQVKERLGREKDVLIAEKFNLEQQLADTRLELDMKRREMEEMSREMEEMSHGGGSEEEFAQLKRSKIEAEKLCKEQEEELDEMAGQIQLLEQAKLRLEMTLETMRKEGRRESQQRDDELDEVKNSNFKKIKALECQLETEHEERTLLLREKHELERRLKSVEEQDRVDRAAEDAANQKLRRDLRKYKALLKDAQAQIERMKSDSPGKQLIRQLRNQIEDADSARAIALKARQTAETDLSDLQMLLDDANRSRSEAETKATQAQRERSELQIQFEENEEEMAELMKKYGTVVKQLNGEQSTIAENEIRIAELESERNSLKEQVEELHMRLENVESITDTSTNIQTKRLEMKVKEVESRLELEQATRTRLEVQFNRYKESLEKSQQEVSQIKAKEQSAQDSLKKAQKSLRDLREEHHLILNRENDNVAKRKDLEQKCSNSESEITSLRNDLRLALQRIADLQQAMEEGDDDDDDESDSDSSDASEDSQYESSTILARRIQIKSNGILDSSRLDDDEPFNSRMKNSSASSTSIASSDNSFKNGESNLTH